MRARDAFRECETPDVLAPPAANPQEVRMTNVFSENQPKPMDAPGFAQIEMIAVLESEQRDAEQAMREAAIRYGEAEPLAEMQLLQAADRYAQARRAAISLMQ